MASYYRAKSNYILIPPLWTRKKTSRAAWNKKKKVFILNVSKRIFNVLEKANNNNKLIIVEHLVFSQIRRITEYRKNNSQKIGKKRPGRKRYEKTAPKNKKKNPFNWRRPKPPAKVAEESRKEKERIKKQNQKEGIETVKGKCQLFI